jgi:hypothetical protein
MNRFRTRLNQATPSPLYPSLLCLALLAACGGGGGIGSSGTGAAPTTGVASGTVNGFGSIFVAGVRCDDTRAKVTWNTTTGSPETGTPDVKMGQRLELVFDTTATTCKILQARVDPELVGVVSSTAPLTVAGQRVVLVSDASIAPVTVLEGYADASAIHAGDRVEVHGRPVLLNGQLVIQASRIERRPATDVWVRAKGVISGLTDTQFTLGGLTVRRDGSTRLDPADTALANGQTVVVWSNAAVATDGSVTASAIRQAKRNLEALQAVRVEGPVSGCGSTTACTTPTVDGLTVDLSGATFVTGTLADVADGRVLRVEGSWDAERGRLVASKASVRLRDTAAGTVTLIGLVSDFISTTDFTVRGVPVTTDGSTTVAAGCAITPGQIVGITGTLSQSQVQASRVDCLTLVNGTTLDIFGALLNVDLTAKTFNLSEGPYRNYTLTWDDDTVFGNGITAATLANNLRVGLRAVLVDGKLLVKRMAADPTPTNAPPGVQLFGNFGLARDVTATSLTVNRITMNIVPGTTTVNGAVVDGTPVRAWFYRTGPLQPWTALQINKVTWN